MKELTNDQIIALREASLLVDLIITIAGEKYTNNNHQILSYEAINFNNSASFHLKAAQASIPVNAVCSIDLIASNIKIPLFKGKINQTVAISTNRVAINCQAVGANLKMTSTNKYQIIARSGGALCGAIYGNLDNKEPRLICKALPTLMRIIPSEAQSQTLILKITDAGTRYPINAHRKLIIWSADTNQRFVCHGIAENKALLIEPISVNENSLLYVYDECDYSLRTCQSLPDYKGDAYASGPVGSNLDYHAVDFRYAHNHDFNPDIVNFNVLDRDLNNLRYTASIADESAQSFAGMTNSAMQDVAEVLAEAKAYGQSAIALGLAVWASGGTLQGTLALYPAINQALGVVAGLQEKLIDALHLSNLGLGLNNAFQVVGNIIASLTGNDDVIETYPKNGGYFGVPANEQDWAQAEKLLTVGVNGTRFRNFGRSIAAMSPVYKTYKLLRSEEQWSWEERVKVLGIGFGDLADIDVEITIKNAVGTNSYIYGGIEAQNTKIKGLFSRYDYIADFNGAAITPDHKTYTELAGFSPIIEVNGNLQDNVKGALEPNISVVNLPLKSYQKRLRDGESSVKLSKMLGNRNYAHYVIPEHEAGADPQNRFNYATAGFKSAYQNTTYPVRLLHDASLPKARAPVFNTLKLYDSSYNNDDLTLEVAYNSVASINPILFAKVETQTTQIVNQTQKIAVLDFLADEQKTIFAFETQIHIKDLPASYALESKYIKPNSTIIILGANMLALGTDEKVMRPLTTQVFI